MKSLRTSLLIGVTALGMGMTSLAAHADEGHQGRHGHAMSQEQAGARFAEHFAQRQARLHEALKLSAAQEPAWTAFQAAVAPAGMTARADRAAIAKLPAPERMEKMLAFAKQRITRMESHLVALKTFYAVLTPEQQTVFDEKAGRRHHKRWHH